MKVQAKLSFALLAILISFLGLNSLIPRDISIIVYSEDDNRDFQTRLFVDDVLSYEGGVGYGVFGHKKVDKKLTGGFHRLQMTLDGKVVVDQNVFIALRESFQIVVWKVDGSEIELNKTYRAFYFE